MSGADDAIEGFQAMFRKFLVPAWACLNGALLAFAVVFFTQSRFIAAEVQYLVAAVTTPGMSTEQRALALLRETKAIYDFGSRHAGSVDSGFIQRLPIRSFDELIMLPVAGCGDASGILYRLLTDAGIPARIGQMSCGDEEGCHIFVEGNIGGRWVVLDPLFGAAFRDEDDRLATFGELSANWPFYRRQVSADYPEKFAYEGVRYTNWQKIPVLMPVLRRVLVAVLGEERTSEISLRSLFMAPNRLYFSLCLVALVLVNGIGLGMRRRRSTKRATKSDDLPQGASTSLLS